MNSGQMPRFGFFAAILVRLCAAYRGKRLLLPRRWRFRLRGLARNAVMMA